MRPIECDKTMTESARADRETELKLALPPDAADTFVRRMAAWRQTPTRQHLVTRYYDTPAFDLAAAGVAVRVRRVGRRWVQTLKTEGDRAGGLSLRGEYETPAPGGRLDWARFPDAARARVPEPWRARLGVVFETDFVRTAWRLRRGDATIEVALDVGEIRAGARRLPLSEVELELERGDVDALYALAIQLAEDVDLVPDDASKAERGTRLAQGLADAPRRAGPVALDRGMDVGEAFAAICRACLGQLQANLHGIGGEDPEFLHQARVALRQLRAARRLFAAACPLPASLDEGLDRLAGALGTARDWDVLCLQVLPAIAPHYPEAARWARLTAAAGRERQAARAAMQATLSQVRPGRWLLAFHRWLAQPGCGGEGAAAVSGLVPFVRAALARGLRRIRRRGEHWKTLTAPQRHALRIAIKRQRYAMGFFRTLLPRSCEATIEGLAELQDALGRANDERVAARLLAGLAAADDDVHATGFAAGWLARGGIEPLPRNIEKQLKNLMKSGECW